MPAALLPVSLRGLRLLPVAALIILGACGIAGCNDDTTATISGSTNPETTPTMTTVDVNTVISDSGVTRYKIVTPLWLVFDEAKEAVWRFPEGMHLEKFDLRLQPEASIDCDSATYFKNRQLWRLDGFVNIHNTVGEKFLTTQLFWDQRLQKIYSDSFIHIERDDKIIEGYGFESNETMTRYHVKRVAGIFPANRFAPDTTRRAEAMSATIPDTMAVPPPLPATMPAAKPAIMPRKRGAGARDLQKGGEAVREKPLILERPLKRDSR